MRLRGALRHTLGFRARQPRGLPVASVLTLRHPNMKSHWEQVFGPPPPTWEQRTRKAERKLLQATQSESTGNQVRGALRRLARQRRSRPQAGITAVGVNSSMHRLRLRIAQHARLLTLEARSASHHGVHRLRCLLTRQGYPTQEDRTFLDRWLQALVEQHQRAWAAKQLGRSGGKIYTWAPRATAEDNLTTRQPAPQGRGPTLHSRLKGAGADWATLWTGGRPWRDTLHAPLPPHRRGGGTDRAHIHEAGGKPSAQTDGALTSLRPFRSPGQIS